MAYQISFAIMFTIFIDIRCLEARKLGFFVTKLGRKFITGITVFFLVPINASALLMRTRCLISLRSRPQISGLSSETRT